MNDKELYELAHRHGVSLELIEELIQKLHAKGAPAQAPPDADDAPTVGDDPPTGERPGPPPLPGDAPPLRVDDHISSLFDAHESAEGVALALADEASSRVMGRGARAQASPMRGDEPSERSGSSVLGPEASLPTDAPHRPLRTAEGKRYQDQGVLGSGGLGVVRRVRDVTLGRPVAMKLLHPEYLGEPAVVARFIEEAQVTAQLQHPGVAPIHELGQLVDGRLFFTMKEIKGRTLREAIEEVHAVSARAWRAAPSGWTFRRLIDTALRVCEAIAYTHKRGVIHRDLKPDNILLGDHGEVLVVDWGLAKVLGRDPGSIHDEPLERVESVRSRTGRHDTRTGMVSGTPAYMAPEQARGEIERFDRSVDIYALGAILYEILSGRPPYEGDTPQEILGRVATGPPVPLNLTQALYSQQQVEALTDTNVTSVWETSKLPQDLVEVCERAMARNPQDRFEDTTEMVAALKTWLEGDHNRDKARELVTMARAAMADERERRERARELRARAEEAREGLQPWDDVSKKAPAWELEAQAEQAGLEVALKGLEVEQLLSGALVYAQGDEEAHALLTERYRAAHERAEAAGDREAALRAEALMASHLSALSEEHLERPRHMAYLEGGGRLTLHTDPPGARVLARRLGRHQRRLIPSEPTELGFTPLDEVKLARGSYLLEVQAVGHEAVRYPIVIEREGHWHGRPPGARQPHPLRLPRAGELGEDDVYVPAGWFWAGGRGRGTLRRRRLWLDDLILKRFPVTNGQFIEFLDDLVLLGREAQAMEHVPRGRSTMREGEGDPLYRLEEDGFVLNLEGGREAWEMEWPVFMVTWEAANAYARWYSMRTGQVWRLPFELEWEKAARGVDGRAYPWGDHFDPSWCCTEEGHFERAHPQVVNSYPTDASPYGARGMGGNAMDFCADIWRAKGPPLDGERFDARLPEASAEAPRVARGSSWNRSAHLARATHRQLVPASTRADSLGFRLARSR